MPIPSKYGFHDSMPMAIKEERSLVLLHTCNPNTRVVTKVRSQVWGQPGKWEQRQEQVNVPSLYCHVMPSTQWTTVPHLHSSSHKSNQKLLYTRQSMKCSLKYITFRSKEQILTNTKIQKFMTFIVLWLNNINKQQKKLEKNSWKWKTDFGMTSKSL